MVRRFSFQFLAILIIFLLAVLLRFYLLDKLPGEWYGDISIVHAHTEAILSGEWPFRFILSSGPLYHYLIAPIIYFFGYNYWSYKLASNIVSLLVISAIMLLAYEIGGRCIMLMTGVISSFSSWLLIFSRLGNSQIIIPLLTALMGYFFVRWLKTKDNLIIFLAAVVASLGLYGYPQTFILPGVFFLLLFVYLVIKKIFLFP